jgi:hypothetical protein
VPDTVGSNQHKPTSLRGIANKAKSDKRHRFRDLYGCLDAERLLDCWQDLNKSAASGVDGMTAAAYEEDLQANTGGETEIETLPDEVGPAEVHPEGERQREAGSVRLSKTSWFSWPVRSC